MYKYRCGIVGIVGIGRALGVAFLLTLFVGNCAFAENIAQSDPVQLVAQIDETQQMRWPTPTATGIVRGFPEGHKAIDIAAPLCTSVMASAEGIVESLLTGCVNEHGIQRGDCVSRGLCAPNTGYYNGMCNSGYGNAVIIRHLDGSYSAYAHLSEIDAKLSEGGYVAAGQYIGLTGSTGSSSGAHLHFELRTSGDGGYWHCSRYDPMEVVTVPVFEAPQFGGFDNLTTKRAYQGFADIDEGAWYADSVRSAYEMGLISGVSDTEFEPDATLTLGQTVKLAAGLHSAFFGIELEKYGSWYQPSVDYAIVYGIIPKISTIEPARDFSAVVTRAQFAEIMSRSLPDSALLPLYERTQWIDVPEYAAYAPGLDKLARAGVLLGGADGVFSPDSAITRAEAAALLARLAQRS